MSHQQPQPAKRTRRDRLAVVAALTAWLVAVVCGWCAMTGYAYKTDPQFDAAIAATWPADSQLAHDASRPVLIVFLHPKCPCSWATMTELERVLNSGSAATPVFVVFVTPEMPDASWTDSPLVERSRLLACAEVVIDHGGVESERFGAVTSGTVMLFDAKGRRSYAGGITMARGHEGANAGADAVANLLVGNAWPTTQLPAFGCRLVVSRHSATVQRTAPEQLDAAVLGPPTARPLDASLPKAEL